MCISTMRELAINEIIICALEHIKGIIAAALAVALLFASYAFFTSRSNAGTPTDAMATEDSNLEYSILEQFMDKQELSLKNLDDYMKATEKFPIDPSNAFTCTLVVYFNDEEDKYLMTEPVSGGELDLLLPDKLEPVVTLYQLLASSDSEIIQSVREISGIDAGNDYIFSLYAIRKYGRNIMTIAATHPDMEVARKIANDIYSRINEKAPLEALLPSKSAPQTWELIQQGNSAFQMIRQAESNKQLADILTNETNITSYQRTLGVVAPALAEQTGVPVVRIMIFSAVGFVMGAVIGAAFFVFILLFDKRICAESDILKRFDCKLMCVTPLKKPRGVVPKIIESLQAYRLIPASYDSSCDIIAANIADAEGPVLLIGTCDKDALAELAVDIDKRAAVKVAPGGNVLLERSAVTEYKEHKHLLIVEKKGKSLINDVCYEIKMAELDDKKILGFVLV